LRHLSFRIGSGPLKTTRLAEEQENFLIFTNIKEKHHGKILFPREFCKEYKNYPLQAELLAFGRYVQKKPIFFSGADDAIN